MCASRASPPKDRRAGTVPTLAMPIAIYNKWAEGSVRFGANAGGRTRTDTHLRAGDFEPPASTVPPHPQESRATPMPRPAVDQPLIAHLFRAPRPRETPDGTIEAWSSCHEPGWLGSRVAGRAVRQRAPEIISRTALLDGGLESGEYAPKQNHDRASDRCRHPEDLQRRGHAGCSRHGSKQYTGRRCDVCREVVVRGA